VNSRWAIVLLLVNLLTGCGGCSPEQRSPAQASSTGGEGGPAQPTPAAAVLDAGRQAPPREGNPLFEIAEGPINRRMYLQAGRPDFANRYATTVMVTSKDPLEGAECSGLLVSPEVVLTTASCVCRDLNGPACAEHVYASTVLYGEVIREDLADFRVRSYRGVVSPHPEFRLLRDGNGSVVSSWADLALILLEEPMEWEFAQLPLREEESQVGEQLHMAGYGYGTQWGQLYGMRFVRRDPITRASTAGGGRVVYEQQGAFLYNGFHGGPCFYEDERGRWLAGIASVGTERELAFTSLLPCQSWLNAGIERASEAARRQRRE
jgi:hypothetical protein